MANTGGNRVWVAPADKLLDFSQDCDVWGAWLGAIMTPDTWSDDKSHPKLGANLQKNAIDWWINKQQPDFLAADCDFKHEDRYTGSSMPCQNYWYAQVELNALVVKGPSQRCQEQMCAAVARTINPDIIGVGVLVSYLAEAILLTTFVGFYLLDLFTKRRRWHRRENTTMFASASDIDTAPSRPPVDRLDRLIDICRHCVKPFFDTAAFFCISILIAALHTVSVLQKERGDLLPSPARFLELPNPHIRTVAGFYDIALALLAAIFSAFPMCVLGLLSDQGKRRMRMRVATIALAWVLGIPLVALSLVTESHSSSDGWTNEAEVCNSRGGSVYYGCLTILVYIAVVWPLLWLYWLLYYRKGKSGHLSWFLNGSVVVGLVFMWAVLILSLVMRTKIKGEAGKADKSNEFGFGQVLAIFAWAPMIIALGYMWVFGAQTAYNGEMTVDYDAKPAAVSEVLPTDNYQGPEGHEYTAVHEVNR
ncbi:hypothetical protein F5X68DRAFT_249884 [Plectosphaerella plurivora]|uniref:Uncharacterized protein n=1 Tax=Plectosphaerella plurivora TaxID=936078 RepID=A0A9P9A5H2_9PEZI|nr:hypothetical protein F5X68DRAFT_249884 [Plectosphaerella plurivora]